MRVKEVGWGREQQGLLIFYYVPGIMQRAFHMFRPILTKWNHYPHFADQQTEAPGDEMTGPK